MCWMTMFPTAASNDPLANGSCVTEARTNVAAGWRPAAIAIMAAAASTPVASAPRPAIRPAASPAPVPTSMTRIPASTAAASRSGSIAWDVVVLQKPS